MNTAASNKLPIDAALGQIHAALGRQRLVILQAPPGTGKTTRVPPSLIGQPWLDDRRILLLEPRRVAARAAASRMADALGESVGDTIGLRTRDDTRRSNSTRVEVVTEGVLTRMLLADPGLADVGAIIFDEFHERSIHADTALAFSRETCEALRPDLRLLIMSATLDVDALATRLRTDAIIRVEAETHAVTTTYRPAEPGLDRHAHVVSVVLETVNASEHRGDILVFLPGANLISRVDRELRTRLGSRIGHDLVVTPLHGSLDSAAQDRALKVDSEGRRKIILSTPLAETSVTIDGVATVIDGGQRRRPELDLGRGMSRLRTVTASRAAADQRRGRAGRQQPGSCIRLWAEAEQQLRPAEEPPEILISDLTSLALQVAAWGAREPAELAWLDQPPTVAYDAARFVLRDLGAIDDANRVTPHGHELLSLGVEPRLAHMLRRGRELEIDGVAGALRTACHLAAALSDRDLLRGRDRPADLRARLEVMLGRPTPSTDRAARDAALRSVRRWERRLSKGLEGEPGNVDPDLAGLLVSLAFPERIAQRRKNIGGYLLAAGAGVGIDSSDGLAREPWLAIAETDGVGSDARIRSAVPISLDEIEEHHGNRISEVAHGGWDRRVRDVVFERQTRLGAIIVARRPETNVNPEMVNQGLIAGLRREGLGLLNWTKADERYRSRLDFVHQLDPTAWPAVDDQSLVDNAETWLGPSLAGVQRRKDLEQIRVRDALSNLLDWRKGRELDELAPTHLDVPSGSRLPIDYSADGGPALAVRLQEVFGLTESPTVGRGDIAVVLQLLSPAHRPVQVTSDLASFWSDGYHEVRKDLRGRYPKHSWPDDPTTATATSKARRRPQRGS